MPSTSQAMPSPSALSTALTQIDAAHAHDPSSTLLPDGTSLPAELHYAQRSTHYLALRSPSASPILQTAVRAQHFRRWEIPRSSYPATRAGYLQWRTFLKKHQAALVSELLGSCGWEKSDILAMAAIMRKEDMRSSEEAQVLEDVACLVFLEVQFEEFEKGVEEEKMVGILRKTWGKMSEGGGSWRWVWGWMGGGRSWLRRHWRSSW